MPEGFSWAQLGVDLNDHWALDGRDPANVANFMWIPGLHDRPFKSGR